MKTKIKMMGSWSFSRYSDYKLCPAKAKYKHIDKLKEPSSAPMERGADIHTMAEHYIKGRVKELPPELKKFKKEFKDLKKRYAANAGVVALRQTTPSKLKLVPSPSPIVVEDTWAFTKDWERTTWDDWVKCWLRVKLDAAHFIKPGVLLVTDWKSGKFNEDKHEEYMEQLELYALAALLIYPDLEVVIPRLVYVDLGIIYPDAHEQTSYVRDDLLGLQKLWMKRVKPMMNDKTFAPRPNNLCHWCHFRRENGGPCKY